MCRWYSESVVATYLQMRAPRLLVAPQRLHVVEVKGSVTDAGESNRSKGPSTYLVDQKWFPHIDIVVDRYRSMANSGAT